MTAVQERPALREVHNNSPRQAEARDTRDSQERHDEAWVIPSVTPSGPPKSTELWTALNLIASSAVDDTRFPASPTTVTLFHSAVEPRVSLGDFAFRLIRHAGYTEDSLLVAIALMARYQHGVGFRPTRLMVHRLLLACVVVGTKACSDVFLANGYLAQIGGLPLNELNWLEAHLLHAIDFRAVPIGVDLNGIVHRVISDDGVLP